MKKGMKRLVSSLLAIAMVLTTFGVNTKTASAEERTMQNYVYDGYEVDFDVTDAWDGAFNADVKIANTGDAEICDWALTFEFAHEIQNIWNATVVEHTGNTYVIKNADWNANIKPGESVAFGMTVLCDGEIAFPENFSFVMEEESVTAKDYSAEFTLYSDWGTGCNGAIILSNLTNEPIENWQLEFDYDREIVDIANAVIISHEQDRYVIKNAEYNADIAADSSVHISIVAGEGAAEERPENFTMQQTVLGDASTGTEDEMDPVIAERLKGVKYKEPEEEHIQYDEASDTYYVDNQLALIVKDGVTKEQVENYANELDASVVGYIVVTGDYQLEFATAKSWEELHALTEKISGYDWVEDVLLQELFEIDFCVTPDDPAWFMGDYEDDEWDESFPAGYNWGLEAINARSAWEYEGDKVKVGIIDTMFDQNHVDLEFAKTWGNESDVAALYQDSLEDGEGVEDASHGTHVAGTLGATYNNGKGITGVGKNLELYAVSVVSEDMKQFGNYSQFTYALANLIFCECKVINVSMSKKQGIDEGKSIYGNFLKKLLSLGYDFVIVQAAGNHTEDASSAALFVNIDEPELKNRIIVVGSVDLNKPIKNEYYYMQKYTKSDYLFGGYSYSSFSNYGSRVDICAPGRNIYSTVPGNGYTNMYYGEVTWNGTSMAAPHVSGVAALCYSVNPKLTGIQVKEIVCGSVNRYVTRNINERYPLLNAEKAVYVAMNTQGQLPEQEPVLQGVVHGKVIEYELLSNACPPNQGIGTTKATVFVYTVNNENGELGKLVNNVDVSSTGEFSIILPEGVYSIMLYSEEYLPIMKTNVRISNGQTENVLFRAYKKGEKGKSEIELEGTIKNAVSGTSVSNAEVDIYGGLIEHIEELEESIKKKYYIDTIEADSDGTYSCKLPEGWYTLLIKKEGYIDGSIHIICMENTETGSETVRQDIVLSPLLSDDEYRIVLTWGDKPRDLDSHLEGYDETGCVFHVYFGNKEFYENGELVAYLDRDDTSSYGPETITLTLRVDNNIRYEYYVYDYSNGGSSSSMALSFSGAKVEVYSSKGKLEEYVIEPSQYGTYWYVFEIENGKIIPNEEDNVT